MIFTEKKKLQNKKIQAYRRGIRAEIIAGLYLSVTGWRVLAWRRKCPLGEIDTITAHQWRRISEAADLFMARHGQYADCSWRFDAIIIVPRKWPRRFKNMWLD